MSMWEPKKYRKKAVVIEAFRWDGTGKSVWEIVEWANGFDPDGGDFTVQGKTQDGKGREVIKFTVNTLEGEMKIGQGDYVIRGVEGEYYPCKSSVFDKTYEAVIG